METIVMKFGGASLATPMHFGLVAELIAQRAKEVRVVVVVSAMAGMTDELIALAKMVHPAPPARELDMLVSVGERKSMALLAMALQLKGYEAISFTGSQSGIITTGEHSEARIIDVRPGRLQKGLEVGKIVIVAGFQGVSREGEITTLGRGGSDTTAVALAVALNSKCAEFYKDVPGVFSADPKKNLEAKMFPYLTFKEGLAIVENGAKVLHPRCLRLAERNDVPIYVRSCDPMCQVEGTRIGPLEKKQLTYFYEV